MEVCNSYINTKIFTCSFKKLRLILLLPFPFSSTQIALIHLLDKITYLLDEKDTAAVSLIAIDIKKAFDIVDHKLFLNKLSYFMPLNILLLMKLILKSACERN